MKEFKEFINEAVGNSPYSDRDIMKFLKNAGLTDMQFDTLVYGGYSSTARTHVYATVWQDENEYQENERGEPLNYAVNILWVYVGKTGKIEADVSPMPEEEELHVDTARKLAVPVARKELRRLK